MQLERIRQLAVKVLFLGQPPTQLTASGADLNLLAGVAASGTGVKRIVKVPLAAADTGGGIFSWANPEAGSIIITRVIVDVTTVATGACTVDVGATAASATTVSDNLIDGIDVHAATGLLGQADGDGVVNSKLQQKLATGKWVTGSKASGASAGLVGNAYIEYELV